MEQRNFYAAKCGRLLGREAAHLIGVTRWAWQQCIRSQIRLEGNGIGRQVISRVASATDPTLFSQVDLNGGKHSLSYLVEAPVEFKDALELFCFDLYKDFDADLLAALAKPAEVILHGFVKFRSGNRIPKLGHKRSEISQTTLG